MTNVVFVPFRNRSRSPQESHALDAATEWILSELSPTHGDRCDIDSMRAVAEKELRRPRDGIHRRWATVFLKEIDLGKE